MNIHLRKFSKYQFCCEITDIYRIKQILTDIYLENIYIYEEINKINGTRPS